MCDIFFHYVMDNGDKIIVRPSGTEPKIKIYILAHGDDSASLAEKVACYASEAEKIAEI